MINNKISTQPTQPNNCNSLEQEENTESHHLGNTTNLDPSQHPENLSISTGKHLINSVRPLAMIIYNNCNFRSTNSRKF